VASDRKRSPEEPDPPDGLARLAAVRRVLEKDPPRWGYGLLGYASEEELAALEAVVDAGPSWLADRGEVLLAVLEDRRRRDEGVST